MSVSGGKESAVPKATTQLLPEPLPGLPDRDPTWVRAPDLFTIAVVSGPDPLLCLLLLLLLASHSQEPLPQGAILLSESLSTSSVSKDQTWVWNTILEPSWR